MSVHWETSGFLAGLTSLDSKVRAAREPAGVAAMTHVAQVSAEEVPVETGTLLGTQEIKGSEDGTTSIKYGTPYARYQHERLDLRHEHGNAKYLEGPLIHEKDEALDIAADVIRRAL